MRQSFFQLLARKLLFSGFGAEKNRLIVKSFFRKRPVFVCSKIQIAYKYIITILLSNINYTKYMYLKKINNLIQFYNIKYLQKNSYAVQNTKYLTTIFFSSLLHFYYKRRNIYMMQYTINHINISVSSLIDCFQSQIRVLNVFKFFFFLKLLSLRLLNSHFFWKVGFGRPLGRSSLETINRSPHTDKRSRSQFSRKTYKAVLKCPLFLLCSKLLFIKRFLHLEAYSTLETISVIDRL